MKLTPEKPPLTDMSVGGDEERTLVSEVVSAEGQGARRAPDFFLVGHSKCGTTAIYDMLKDHPQLYLPVKEPRYFVPELRSRYWRPASSRRKRPRTLDGYLALFTGAGRDQLIGEATPEYLRSFTAPARIAAVRPDAKIIAVLREPTSFLRSLHMQAVHNYTETEKDFQRAIALEEDRRRGKHVPLFSQSPKSLLYSDHVRYADQLRSYHEAFPAENVLVLIYDDFRADNEGTMRTVLRFLGVDEDVEMQPRRTGTLPTVRVLSLHQLARVVMLARRHPAVGRPMRKLGRLVPSRLASLWGACWRRVVYKDAVAPDEQFLLELRRSFKPQVAALSDYLGRDLVSLWGYDSLD